MPEVCGKVLKMEKNLFIPYGPPWGVSTYPIDDRQRKFQIIIIKNLVQSPTGYVLERSPFCVSLNAQLQPFGVSEGIKWGRKLNS